MFGLNLDIDALAAIAGGAALLARITYSLLLHFRRWAADADPAAPISVGGMTVSAIALTLLAFGVASLLSNGLPKAARVVLLGGVCLVNFFAGAFLDMALNLRLSHFVRRLRAFRVPKYREQLGDPDREKQLAAAKRLFYVGHGAGPAIPELLAASRGDSNEVRTYALLALWRTESDDPQVGQAARSALHDPDLMVRAAAAIALVRFQHPPEDLLVPLCDGLAQYSHQVAISSYEALLDLGPAALPALPAIRKLVLAANYPQTSGAVMILGKVGADGVPVLIEVLEGGNKFAKQDAAYALGEMGEVARPAFPALRAAEKDSDLMVRSAAQASLRKLGANVG